MVRDGRFLSSITDIALKFETRLSALAKGAFPATMLRLILMLCICGVEVAAAAETAPAEDRALLQLLAAQIAEILPSCRRA